MRELLNFTQEEVAEKMGVSQQTVSNIESDETVDREQLEKVAQAMSVSPEAIKDLQEDATVYNIVTTNNGAVGLQNYNCTFNPFDKWAEAVEENKKLYEALLKEKDEKVALIERLLEEGKGS